MASDSSDKKYLLTVVCTVYNHEQYLRKCLDGIVNQKTDFAFEAIVHDDASTDGSQAIISDYAKRYPSIIKPIFQKENQYSKHNGSLRKAINPNIRGKYVAICEGDDYWTDSDKLQKQVDFLEKNPDVTLCFHNVRIVNRDGTLLHGNLYAHLEQRYYTAGEIISRWTVPTCSAVVRADCYLATPYDRRFAVGDNVIWLKCLENGKAYCINNKMAVYRRDINGWTLKSYNGDKGVVLSSYKKYLCHLQTLMQYFPGLADQEIIQSQSTYIARIFIIDFCKLKPGAVKTLCTGLKIQKLKFFHTLTKEVFDRIKVRVRICNTKN